MFRFKKGLLTLAALAAALTLGTSQAQAGASITLQEVGVAGPTTIPLIVLGGVYATGPIVFGDYQINVTGNDSAPGANPITHLQTITQNTISVKALNLGAGDLIITVQDDSFTNLGPGSQATLSNSLSATQIDTGTVKAHGFVLSGGATTDVTLNAPIEPPVAGSIGNSALITLPGTSTFTMGNVATVHGLVVGATDNFTVTTTLAVPAPAGFVLALAGLPVLGLGWLRRRSLVANA
ncbi:MAG TPA: hypothetical protein VGF55_22460 [Gemmataceae bacterium]|jgi:hypothetical protein